MILFEEILEPLFHYISYSPNIIEEFSKFDIYWDSFKKYTDKICENIIQHNISNKTLIYFHDYYFF